MQFSSPEAHPRAVKEACSCPSSRDKNSSTATKVSSTPTLTILSLPEGSWVSEDSTPKAVVKHGSFYSGIKANSLLLFQCAVGDVRENCLFVCLFSLPLLAGLLYFCRLHNRVEAQTQCRSLCLLNIGEKI